MERLDHLRPPPSAGGSYWYTHLERQEREDYDFMIEHGETHERALQRLGINPNTWAKRNERAS